MVFYLVLFCIHVCADDVIEEKSNNNNKKKKARSPYRINFSVYFSIQYIHIKSIFKTVSQFFLLLYGF